ncbi:MAG: hypothetical protein ACI97K_000285 [Glaciecola sp.]|jgi:hypothetical protein
MIAAQLELNASTYMSYHHDIFTHFFAEHVNVCGWQRKLSKSVYDYSALLAEHQIKIVREISPEEVFCELNGLLPDSQDKHTFLEDVHLLSDMMCCIFDCKTVGLRLATLDHAMCPKFHTDKISGRLICTYMGEGTQWLPNSAKDYLESLNQTKAHCKMEDEHEILSAKQGDVLLLKGDAWPNNDGKGAIHRSPPTSLNQTRVLLTLDPM